MPNMPQQPRLELRGPQLRPTLEPMGRWRSIGAPPPPQPPSVKLKSVEEHLDPYLLPGTKPGSNHSSPNELRHQTTALGTISNAFFPEDASYMGQTSPRKVLEQRVYGKDTQNQLNQANEYNKKHGLPKLEIDTPTDLYTHLTGGSSSLSDKAQSAALINPRDFINPSGRYARDARTNIQNGVQPIKPGQLPTQNSSSDTLLDPQKSPFDISSEKINRGFADDLNLPEATKQIIFSKGPQFQQFSSETAPELEKQLATLPVVNNPYLPLTHDGSIAPKSDNSLIDAYNRFTDEAVGELMNHEIGGHGIYVRTNMPNLKMSDVNPSSPTRRRELRQMLEDTPARKMVGGTVPNWEGDMSSYQANPGEMVNGLTGLQRSKYLTEGQRWTNPNDFKRYMQGVMNSGDVEKSMQGISPDGKRFIRSLVPLSPNERQKVINRAAKIIPGIVQNSNIGYNQKIGEYINMNEHFYNGFIKRAQDYGLSAVEADRLIKAAGPVNEGAAAYAGYPKHPLTREPMASQNTLDAFKGQMPKPTPRPTPKPTPTPKRNINPYTEGDLNDRKASSGTPTQLQIETANMMRRNNSGR